MVCPVWVVQQYKWVAPVATTFTVVLETAEFTYFMQPRLYLDTDGTFDGLRTLGDLYSGDNCVGANPDFFSQCIFGGMAARNQNFVIKVRAEVLSSVAGLMELHHACYVDAGGPFFDR